MKHTYARKKSIAFEKKPVVTQKRSQKQFTLDS